MASLRKNLPGTPWTDPGSELQKRGEVAVKKIYDAYKTLYPDALTGMDVPPRVVINDGATFNAFAYVLPVIDHGTAPRRVPWVFVYNKGFFASRISDEQITLVAAHEMGHFFLRNGNPNFFTPIFYRETPEQQRKIFGEYDTLEDDADEAAVRIARRTTSRRAWRSSMAGRYRNTAARSTSTTAIAGARIAIAS